MLRMPVFAGNWKLNKGPAATTAFLEEFARHVPDSLPGSALIFPPAISLTTARAALTAAMPVSLGVQNIHWEESGAFTGETSATMAKEAGADFVLVGHSERRQLFGETEEETRWKLRAALDGGLRPMLCLGETIEERERGEAAAVVARQLDAAVSGLDPDELGTLLIAYEPVWAIGTGRTASPTDAADMHRQIRIELGHILPVGDAARIPLLYGGSVNPDNAAELLAAPQVDGLLIGGASLDPHGFARICRLTA